MFGACRKLDFELEMGCIVGVGNAIGEPVPIDAASGKLFGMVLLNDWSARDIQQWEYIPLGPFNSKTFATSISPWIVTMEALEPFRVEGPVAGAGSARVSGNDGPTGLRHPPRGGARIARQVSGDDLADELSSHVLERRAAGGAPHGVRLQFARVGDLIGSGTISGDTPDSYGSLLELTWNGTKPLKLPDGSERTFLEDDDEVILAGWAQGEGLPRRLR